MTPHPCYKPEGSRPQTMSNFLYENILTEPLKDNSPSDVIKIRGGPPGTSFIGPVE